MFFRVAREVRHFPARPAKYAAILAAAAVLSWWWPAAHRLLTVTAVAVWVVLVGWWAARRLLTPLTTRSWVDRRDEESAHAGGVASRLDVGEHASAGAMRRQATTLRPSLRKVGPWARRRVPVTSYAVLLVKAGWLSATSRVYSSCEEMTLRIGGPRSGKSGSIGCHALDAPGALLVTSSRTDLLDATGPHRRTLGRVDVFNPSGLGGLASTVRWSPLAGCTDYATAKRRAEDLIPESTGDAERWDKQARRFLALLMHAAALSGGTMRTVVDWISPADDIARDQVLAAIASSPWARARASEVREIYGTNDRTLTSITTTMAPALEWVSEETAATVGDAPLDDPDFLDVARFVASGRDSLYLVGRVASSRALSAALTSEVAHQVRMIAAGMPGGRLDPPMTGVLDEAPLTCGAIPLHDWTADMGGRNFTLHIVAQSLAQLRDVYGPDRANAILGNVGAFLVFGNLKSTDDLERISTLAGTRLVQLDADDARHVPVMTPAEIAALPVYTALVIRNRMRPIVGRAPMAWDRTRKLTRAARTTRRHLTRTARVLARPARIAWTASQPARAAAGEALARLAARAGTLARGWAAAAVRPLTRLGIGRLPARLTGGLFWRRRPVPATEPGVVEPVTLDLRAIEAAPQRGEPR